MSQEVAFSYKTRGNSSPKDKPRVYFTCHPEDFERFFEKICEDIFKTHDCAIYYTDDMTADLSNENNLVDLERMNLFVIPVTFRLLTQSNRAMDSDFRFAMEKHIPILPMMMEPGIDEFYSKPDKFGELQYIDPYSHDLTAISYEEKLKKYLESVLISDELAQRVRQAFDAYIFLSYRKKDRKHANELMKSIHNNPEFRDIAIWFDEFLIPGESFRENIERILMKSDLFALLVTPSLLEKPDGKPNYVMAEEYPAAKKIGKSILPAEMEETDKGALRKDYYGIPECVNAHDDKAFRERLIDCLNRVAILENNNEPEHNYLIGLAYLEGIDVEVDNKRGVELITKSAEAEYDAAMKKLVNLYLTGDGVSRNERKAHSWQKKLVSVLRDKAEETYSEGDALDLLCEGINLGDISNSIGDYDEAEKAFSDSYNLAKTLSFGAVSKTNIGKLKTLFKKYILRNSPVYEQSILYLIKSGRMMLELSFARGNFDDIVEWSKKATVLIGAVHKQFESEETARELLILVDRMSKECLESGNLTGAQEWLQKGRECWGELESGSTTREVRFSASRLYDALSEYHSVKSDYSSSFVCQEKRWELLYGLHEELPDDYSIRYELIDCQLSKADISRLGGDLACAKKLFKQTEELISYEGHDLSLPVIVLHSRYYLLNGKIAYSQKDYASAIKKLKQGYETLLPVTKVASNIRHSRYLAEFYELIGDSYRELAQNAAAFEWYKKVASVISEILAHSGMVKDTRALARIYEKLLGEAIIARDTISITEFNEKCLWTRKALAEGTAINQKTVGELIEKGKIESAFYEQDIAAYKRILEHQDEIYQLMSELPEKDDQLIDSFRKEKIDTVVLFQGVGELTEEFVKTHKAENIMHALMSFAKDLKEIARQTNLDGKLLTSNLNIMRCAKEIYDYILKLYNPFFRFDEQAMLLMVFCERLYITMSIKSQAEKTKEIEALKKRFEDIVFLHYSVDDIKYIKLWNQLWNWTNRDL